MNMRERIAKAIRDSGKKKSEIADLVGVSTAAVTQWESRETKTLKAENLMALAKATGRSPQWLATGEGPETPSNVEPGPRLRGLVPVISWVAAGAWDEAADPYAPGDGQDWKACPVSHSGRTYALRVRGDSMTAPHGKSYPDGCLIFVDPERRVPEHGQPVIAKINGDAEVTFKLFMRDAGRVWLRALNPAYPPITDEFAVLGSVIGKWEDA